MRILAMVSMSVDHFAVAFLSGMPYTLCRLFGRLAFPLFSWLVVEGSFRTSSHKKYCLNVFFLGLVSQPLFMYFFGVRYLNVCFLYLLFLVLVFGFYKWFALLAFLSCFCRFEYGLMGYALLLTMYIVRSRHPVAFPDKKLPKAISYGFYPFHLALLCVLQYLIQAI